MNKLIQWFTEVPEKTPASTLIIRLMAGGVFFSEGILKFVYTNQGVGRFTKLGFPFPDVLATGIGCLEIVGGLMLIFGLCTRLMSLVFIGEMIVAILSTKVSLYLGTYPLPLPPAPPTVGIWAVLHEIRADYAQIMCSAFLLIVGAGPNSLDWILFGDKKSSGAKRN